MKTSVGFHLDQENAHHRFSRLQGLDDASHVLFFCLGLPHARARPCLFNPVLSFGRENGRATLVGERTFGKGVIQTVEPLTSGGGVAVTVARRDGPTAVVTFLFLFLVN